MRITRVFGVAVAVVLGILAVLPAGLRAQSGAANPGLTQFYILTGSDQLVTANSADLAQLGSPVTVSGLTAGDRLVSIDVRPQNGRLYGLGYNAAAGTVQLYHISPASGVAVPMGPTGSFQTTTGVPIPITGTRFGLDFNPTVDRARVVNSSGQNFHMNPNTGTFVDNDANPANGIQPDGNINGEGATGADETAYTNNAPNVTATTQYTLDPVVDRLFIQNPPNNGTQTVGKPITLNGTPVNFAAANGFDIPPGVDVATPAAAATGAGYAVIDSGTARQLHRIELSTGAATPIGTLSSITVSGLAVWMPLTVANALSGDGLSLQRLRLDAPGPFATAAISGVTPGETLVGIDGRPSNGQLFGLGINDSLNNGTLYLIDPQSGPGAATATAIGVPGSIAFVTATGQQVDLPAATVGYGVDFNPTVDRIRVTTNGGLNFRANPVNGAPVDGNADPSAPGTQPDGNINGLPAGSTGVSATAYTNVFAGTTVTTQYTLDPTSKRLYIQNPPNTGTQTNPLAVSVGNTVLDFGAVNGFDIPTGVNAAASNAPVSGNAYAALTVGGSTGVYRINLATGATTALGTLGAGTTGASGFVVWSETTPGLRSWLPMIMK